MYDRFTADQWERGGGHISINDAWTTGFLSMEGRQN